MANVLPSYEIQSFNIFIFWAIEVLDDLNEAKPTKLEHNDGERMQESIYV